jgi:hypothetical protein
MEERSVVGRPVGTMLSDRISLSVFICMFSSVASIVEPIEDQVVGSKVSLSSLTVNVTAAGDAAGDGSAVSDEAGSASANSIIERGVGPKDGMPVDSGVSSSGGLVKASGANVVDGSKVDTGVGSTVDDNTPVGSNVATVMATMLGLAPAFHPPQMQK